MDALITQRFEFNALSYRYAEFIIDALRGYPEGQLKNITSVYFKSPDIICVEFEAPEEISTFLKLKYGQECRQFPNLEETSDILKLIQEYSKKQEQTTHKKWDLGTSKKSQNKFMIGDLMKKYFDDKQY